MGEAGGAGESNAEAPAAWAVLGVVYPVCSAGQGARVGETQCLLFL